MEHPIFELLLKGAEFAEVINQAELVLGNPVAFIDTAQNETVLSAHYPKEDMEDKAYRRRQISDSEYQRDTDYVTSMSRTGIPQILAWPHIRRKRLICGCLVHGRHVGGIRLPDIGRRLEDLDVSLIQITASLIGMAYVLQQSSQSEDQSCLWNLLNDRLDASLVDLHVMFSASIPTWKSLCIIWFIPEYYPDYTSNLPLYQKIFSGLPACMTSCGRGVALLSDWDAVERKKTALAQQLEAKHLRAGIGSPGSTIRALQLSCDQAQRCLQFAAQSGRLGLASFRDYQLNYLLSLIPKAQCKPFLNDSPLTQLETFDRQNGTEYLRTVQIYLRCAGNIKQTADQLCVHKNTVFYRLTKLREELGFDLNQPDTLSLLNCLLIIKDQLADHQPDILTNDSCQKTTSAV